MLLHSPSTRVPPHLLPEVASGYAPALTVYKEGGDPSISVSGDEITVEGETFNYTTQSVRRLAASIGRALPSVTVTAHVEVTPTEGEIFLEAGDLSPEGGRIVRFLGLTYRALERTRIRILRPHPEDIHSPWWVRVNRGTFKVTLNETQYHFGVPEYNKQPWSPRFGRPYIDLGNVPGAVLNRKMIRLPRGPIAYARGSITLRVNDQDLLASAIEDVDENNRLVFLRTEVNLNDRVEADYIYREDAYLYKGIDLNPSLQHSPDLLDRFVIFYLRPHRTSLGTINSTTVQHIVANTIEGGVSLLPNDGTPRVLLGAIRTRQVEDAEDVSVEDARSRGGGLKDSVNARSILKESDFYTDIGNWDGKPYPGNSVAIFHIPNGRLELFSDSEVRRIASRHVAAGTLPIVTYVE